MSKARKLIIETKSPKLKRALNESVADEFIDDINIYIKSLTSFLSWLKTVKPDASVDTNDMVRFKEQLGNLVNSLIKLKKINV
jgi:hypothetical protein